MPIKHFAGVVFVALIVTGTVKAEPGSFQNVVESFYKDEFKTLPVLATQVGVHDYDAEVDDLSREGQARNVAHLHQALDAVSAIDPAALPPNDRNDREALISSIKAKLLDVETIRYWQKDPNVYLQTATSAVFHLLHRDFAPLEDRLRSVIARERKIPALLATGKFNVEHPPRPFVEIALTSSESSLRQMTRLLPPSKISRCILNRS